MELLINNAQLAARIAVAMLDHTEDSRRQV